MTTLALEMSGLHKPRRNDEARLQTSLVAYLQMAAPKALWFAVPNDGKRSQKAGARAKAMGLRPGVADLCFVLKSGHAAFMELKVGANRQSAAQLIFEQRCIDNEVPYVVVTSFDQAVEVLKGWGVVKAGR